MNKPFLSVIMPVYNNEKTILLNLLDVYYYLGQKDYLSEIVAVDDGSTDSTWQMLSRCRPLIDNLKVIHNQHKKGMSFAVKQAMFSAKGSWRVIISPSNFVSVAEFDKFFPYTKSGYEVFLSAGDYFKCFSAQVAEKIFLAIDDSLNLNKELLKLAKKNYLKVKMVSIGNHKKKKSMVDYLNYLWHI